LAWSRKSSHHLPRQERERRAANTSFAQPVVRRGRTMKAPVRELRKPKVGTIKRSRINAILANSIRFCERMKFHLPPFAFWSPEDWRKAGHEYDEIRERQLGWDITDYGWGRFRQVGLVLFTIRNGDPNARTAYDKSYCEKLLIVGEGQHTPFHYHMGKMEDIICRGGGNLVIQVYDCTRTGRQLADTPVEINTDGRCYTVEAGSLITLAPGESITLPPRLYHDFWAEDGTSLVGEVSKVNDDEHDNFFLEPVGRFPVIEDDEPTLHLLCQEYPPAGD
jgi:D-lyxose ketol-isomerase